MKQRIHGDLPVVIIIFDDAVFHVVDIWNDAFDFSIFAIDFGFSVTLAVLVRRGGVKFAIIIIFGDCSNNLSVFHLYFLLNLPVFMIADEIAVFFAVDVVDFFKQFSGGVVSFALSILPFSWY